MLGYYRGSLIDIPSMPDFKMLKVTYSTIRFLISHEVYSECSRRDKEDLHARVIQRDEIHEQVEIPNAEH